MHCIKRQFIYTQTHCHFNVSPPKGYSVKAQGVGAVFMMYKINLVPNIAGKKPNL